MSSSDSSETQRRPSLAGLDAAVLDLLPIGVSIYSADGVVRRVNAAAERILSVPRHAHEGMHFDDVSWRLLRVDGTQLPVRETPAALCLATGKAVTSVELGAEQPDGNIVWLDVSASPLPDGGAVVTYSDVSDRHREEAIRAARARLSEFAVSASLPDVLRVTLDEIEHLTGSCIGFYHFVAADGNGLSLQAWSTRTEKEFCKAAGKGMHYPLEHSGVWADAVRNRQPVIHNSYLDLEHRKGMPEGHAHIERELVVPVVRGGRIVAVLGIGNKRFAYDARDVAIVQRMADLAWDLAEWKRAEESLWIKDAAIGASLNGVIITTLDVRITDINEAAARMWQLTRHEMIGRDLGDFLEDVVDETVTRVLRDGGAVGSIEVRRSDGTPVYLDYSAALVRDAAGHPAGFALNVIDATERRRAEEELRASEARFRAVVLQSPLPKLVCSLTGEVRHLNDAFVDAFGYGAGEIRTLEDWWEKLFVDPSYRAQVRAASERSRAEAQRTGEPTTLEYTIVCKDGTKKTLQRHGAVIGDNWVVIFHDITESRRLQAELSEAAEHFRMLVNTSLDGFFFSSHGVILDANETYARMLGYTVEELRGMPISRLDGQETPEDVATHTEKIARLGYDRFETTHRARNGELIPVEISAMFDRHGGFVSFIRDLRERRAAEIAVRDSEQKFAHLFRMSSDALHLTDAETHQILDVNNVFESLSGYSAAEVIGRTSTELGFWVREEDRSGFWQRLHEGKGTARGYEVELADRHGRRFWVELSAELIEFRGRKYVLTSTRDITERRRVEAQLRSSEALLRAAQRIARIGSWSLRIDDERITWSDQTYEIFGVDKAAFVPTGPTVLAMITPESAARVHAVHMHTLSTGEPYSVSFERVRDDGSTQYFHARGEAMLDASGQIVGAVGMVQDVTEQRLAEEHLRDSTRFLREAQKAGKVGTYLWDIARDEWASSAELDDIFGIDVNYPRTVQGWMQLIAPEWREQMNAYVRNVVANDLPFDQQYPIVKPSTGELRWVHGTGAIERDADGNVTRLLGVIQDITERKKTDEELRQIRDHLFRAQKMESLGRLAGGVAHDINNVLAAILGLSSAYADSELPGTPLHDALEAISKACVRGRTTVSSLLGFARQELTEERIIDVNRIIDEEIRLLERTTLRRILIARELSADLWPIKGDYSALTNAVMNLCVNAVDAMPDGGTLTLRTRNIAPSSIEVSIADTGVGMAPNIVERAFDPFFTTKPQGQGTGLGLSIVYGTVRAHAGDVKIDSAPGEGTRITMRFPAQVGATVEAAPEPQPAAAPAGGSLRILLVDDDADVRETMEMLLARLKHKVTVASSGEESLTVLGAGLGCDLVLLDLNMPGLGGAGTLRRIRESRPDLHVMVSTGLADQRALDLTQTYPLVTLLQKPFTMTELRAALDAVAVAVKAD